MIDCSYYNSIAFIHVAPLLFLETLAKSVVSDTITKLLYKQSSNSKDHHHHPSALTPILFGAFAICSNFSSHIIVHAVHPSFP